MDMEEDNQSQQPISDDQELAKALAGISDQSEAGAAPVTPVANDALAETPDVPEVRKAVTTSDDSEASSDLDGVKRQAIDELRPLVGKLTIAPEEKFDTYLLLLRSTDDRSLVAPAHEVAIQIQDETRRAQALLDIIKEIDYFSHPQQ